MSNVIILFTLMSKYRYTGNTKMKAYTECLLNSLQFTKCLLTRIHKAQNYCCLIALFSVT